MVKTIIWTSPAVADLQDIYDFISKDSEFYAKSFVNELIDSTERLVTFPKIARKAPEFDNENIRDLIFQNYRIIYLIKDESIFILAVVHTRRDLQLPEE